MDDDDDNYDDGDYKLHHSKSSADIVLSGQLISNSHRRKGNIKKV
jgi:hypothetical protein